MPKPQDLKLPFAFEKRQAIIFDRLWYVPAKVDSPNFSFPGFGDSTLFGNDQPLFIEYCSGNGSWILEKAKLNPTNNYLAVEMSFERARKIWAKIHNMKLTNLVVAWAEGLELTQKYIPHSCVSGIYINFPDPWPKRRHAKYRIINQPFLQEMHRILKPESCITTVTDHEDYSKIMIKEFISHKGFQSLIEAPYFEEPKPDYGSSFFEELFKSKGKTIRLHSFAKDDQK